MKALVARSPFWMPEACTENGRLGENAEMALSAVVQASLL